MQYYFLKQNNWLLSIEWNSRRLSGPAHGIVTKTMPGGGGDLGVVGFGSGFLSAIR